MRQQLVSLHQRRVNTDASISEYRGRLNQAMERKSGIDAEVEQATTFLNQLVRDRTARNNIWV